jgi:phosphoglycerate kinase
MKHFNQNLKNKRVLLRIDVNEPLDTAGELADDFRLQAVAPTILQLQKQNCQIILCGHLGRPGGEWNEKYSLRPVAERLAKLLKLKFVTTDSKLPKYPTNHLIFFTGNIEEKNIREQLEQSLSRDVVMLENLRFYKGEESNDAVFAKQLAELANVYVNDAFAVCHRKSASVVAITKHLPAYAGPLLEKEIKHLNYILKQPKKPLVLMMGGMKITDKERTLQHLGRRADHILLGGGLANLLLQAQGIEIGESAVEKEGRKLAGQLLRNFKDKLVLPKDAAVSNKLYAKSSIRSVPIYNVHKHEVISDIGPQTILQYARILKQAKTIVWNGPMGHFEVKPFHTGTMSLARIIGGISRRHAFSVVGGGETVDAVRMAHQQDYIDHLSTGGGAMLEYLSGNKLPGLEALL